MPRWCANLTYLFTEVPLLQRIAAARVAGFEAVEILFPYDEPAAAIAEECRLNGLKMALINCPPPNWTGGARGYAAVPGGEERFRKDFIRALRFAKVLGAGHLHVMSGEAEGSEARATCIANLKWAAAEADGQSLTIEPLNPVSMPGYFLNDFDQALDIVTEVGAPNLKLQFDTFHAQMIHGDMASVWERCAAQTVHVQVSNVPDRTEPVKGEIDFPGFFARLDREGYKGWVSAEYRPSGPTAESFGWMRTGS